MKKLLIYIAMAGATLLTSSCNDWLDVLPKNEQVSPEYWKTKEQVEEVLAQGYQNMRLTVPTLIYWGELRGASIYAYSGKSKQELQNFQLNSSSGECKWGGFYSILNVANSIIKYAPEVKRQDETYHEAVMNSNMAEAYFMLSIYPNLRKRRLSHKSSWISRMHFPQEQLKKCMMMKTGPA